MLAAIRYSSLRYADAVISLFAISPLIAAALMPAFADIDARRYVAAFDAGYAAAYAMMMLARFHLFRQRHRHMMLLRRWMPYLPCFSGMLFTAFFRQVLMAYVYASAPSISALLPAAARYGADAFPSSD